MWLFTALLYAKCEVIVQTLCIGFLGASKVEYSFKGKVLVGV